MYTVALVFAGVVYSVLQEMELVKHGMSALSVI